MQKPVCYNTEIVGMMNMDKGEDHMRPYQIMRALLDATGYVSVAFLMDQLGVSKRTVQNEIAYLRKSGKAHGFILHNIYAKGYFLEITDQAAVDQFTQDLNSNEAVVDEEHLVIDMIGELLLASGTFLSAQNVADALQVSKSLIFSKIKLWLIISVPIIWDLNVNLIMGCVFTVIMRRFAS